MGFGIWDDVPFWVRFFTGVVLVTGLRVERCRLIVLWMIQTLYKVISSSEETLVASRFRFAKIIKQSPGELNIGLPFHLS